MIAYTVRTHPRARHVRLRFDPHQGLIVTVPKRFDQRRLPALIAQRKAWIEAMQVRHAQLRQARNPELFGTRPGRIELPAIGESWSIAYAARSSRRLGFGQDQGQGHLVFRLPEQPPGDIDQRIAQRLKRWLIDRASQTLKPRVAELARQHGFRHGPIAIRCQRARWGSCSARGHLSLNARLLFASPEACRYVLIHELVHTEHLDHSPAFWRRVASLDPDYQVHQAQLNAVWQQLPDWLHRASAPRAVGA